MKSLKNHLSLILALTALLATFQAFVSFAQIVSDYETELGDEYAIVLVAKSALEIADIARVVPQTIGLEEIASSAILDEVKESVGEANFAYLKNALPRFYRLRLSHYPSIFERSEIEKRLSQNSAIVRAETFAKTQDRIYKLLQMIKASLLTLAVLTFFVASLLIVRQMEIWRFEHRKRISVMAIFGAPMWLRSAILYRLAIVDSIISALIVGGLFYYISADSVLKDMLFEIGLGGARYDVVKSSVTLFAAAIIISLGSATYAIVNAEEDE